MKNRITSPDVNIFIYSGLSSGKECKQYFEKIRFNLIKKAILLGTVYRRFFRWLQDLLPSIRLFLKTKGVDYKTYLAEIKSGIRLSSEMKRIRRYSNVIEALFNRYKTIDEVKITSIYDELRNHFNSLVQLFMKPPNQILEDVTDNDYKKTIFDDLNKLTNGSFTDVEDSEHLALLNYYTNQQGNLEPLFFVTEDGNLCKFAKIFYEKWNSHIIILKPIDFLTTLPDFIKIS